MNDFLQRLDKLSPARLKLLALELHERVEELERQQFEPIAVIGIGCRMAHGVDGPAAFWNLLTQGIDAIQEVPADRWNLDEYYHPEAGMPGKMSTRWASFVDGVDCFDAPFFSISRREAESVDPQHRLLLEVCWEALENAGWASRKLAGSDTGVFVGISTGDYQDLLLARGEQSIDAHAATGGARSVAAGRISYALGLQGPSMAVDTACSSSLVAIHLGCQSLRSGECRMALAGGVNAILSPGVSIALSQAHMMSPDGHCKAFDARADGFVRGEGCGVVVLKRLSDALRDRDYVYGVIRGSAINQDGRSGGITAPNGSAQEAVIRLALANAGVKPGTIDYVEAHGTGTSLGDPIEAHALAAVLREGREKPLVLGSVKTNIGHLEAAAGVAGLIKTLLALQHEQIPPHLHFQQWNPHIQWNGMPVTIPVEALPWPKGERPRRAGVSSFGFSGTNAHVIVEEAPEQTAPPREFARPLHLLALSAQNTTGLDQMKARWNAALATNSHDPGDLCYTANAGRSHHAERAVYVAATREQLRDALAGKPIASGRKEAPVGSIAFLFPGQGAQYAGMGKELYDSQPVFRRALDECAELLRSDLEEALPDILWGARSGLLSETHYTQPALFAIEYSIAQLWRSWGMEPGIVLGHSVGEYVAACIAGVYSLQDGLQFIAARARMMHELSGQGAMLAVLASEQQITDILSGYQDRVSIAALNAAQSVVISGYARELGMVGDRLRHRGFELRPLPVSHGFHSPQMAGMEEAFERLAARMQFQPQKIRMISSVTGKLLESGELADPGYWRRQVRQPVRFRDAIQTLAGQPDRVILEVGPGTTLSGLGKLTLTSEHARWLPSLKKGRSEWEQMLESLGQLYVLGADVDWDGFDAPYNRRRLPLPTYSFQRQRYWMEGARSKPKAEKPAVSSVEESVLRENWFYGVEWDELALVDHSRGTDIRHWLILRDSVGAAEVLAAAFRSAGHICSIADVSIADDLNSLDLNLTAAPDSEIGIVDLRWLELAGCSAAEESCLAVLKLVQALAGRPYGAKARLWLVTRGAVATGRGAESVTPWTTPLWALGRTIEMEHPELWGGLIDIDPAANPADGPALLCECIRFQQSENQAAIRNDCILVPRLQHRAPGPSGNPAFRPDAAYLITGGLGGLGLEVARWMIGHGAHHLILAGRTELPPRSLWDRLPAGSPLGNTITAILALENAGASIYSASVDVGDARALHDFLDRYAAESRPPIRGVVHAAGVPGSATLLETTNADLEAAFRAKVKGSWNLHEAFDGVPLDFFVLFSSAASVMSFPRLGAYAAANAFLDSLAAYRHGLRLPALSINWGVWNEVGFATRFNRESARVMSTRGMDAIQPVDGIRCLGMVWNIKQPQVCVMPGNWAKWAAAYPAYMSAPFLSRVVTGPGFDRLPPDETNSLADRLLHALPAERKNLLVTMVRAEVAAVLRMEPAEIDVNQGVFDLGIDSLMSIELRVRLERLIESKLPATILFTHASVSALADYLDAPSHREKPSRGTVLQPDCTTVDELSEDDLAAMLSAALEEADRS